MKRLYLLLIALLVVFMCPTANALIQGRADNTITVTENFDDTAAIAGNIVNVDSNIDGLGLYAGNTLNIKGSSDYGFIAGNSITINNYSAKDIFVAGNNIAISDFSARTIYAAGSIVTIKGDAKTVYVGGANVTLDGTYENVIVDADDFKLNGKITGKLTINEKAKQDVTTGSEIAATETYKDAEADFNINPQAMFVANIIAKIVAKLFHMVSIIVLGMLFILLFKKTVTKLDKAKADAGYVFAKFGFGLLALIAVPVIGFILLITGLFAGIGITAITVYGLSIYLCEVVGNYYVGKKLFKNMNPYLSFLLSTLIISAISLVPFIGGLLSFFMLCMSLGLIIDLVSSEIKGK